VLIWYIFPRFGILYQEKSSNPGAVADVDHSSSANLDDWKLAKQVTNFSLTISTLGTFVVILSYDRFRNLNQSHDRCVPTYLCEIQSMVMYVGMKYFIVFRKWKKL
jgi:hypothetical protein